VRLLRGAGAALAVVGLVGIAIATLTPMRDVRGVARLTSLTCLICGERGGADLVLNLLLFLPLAIGLRLSGQSWLRTVLVAAAVSFTVELLQLRVVPGRDASLSDLLSNSTSGAIGATIGAVLPRALAPTGRRAVGLLAGGIASVLALLAVSAWLLSPDLPDGRLVSRWAPPSGSWVFGGRVRAVRLDGLPMPVEGSPPDSTALRRRLDDGGLTLEAEVLGSINTCFSTGSAAFLAGCGSSIGVLALGAKTGVAVPATVGGAVWMSDGRLLDVVRAAAGKPPKSLRFRIRE